jgi:putative tricarboxylic transport membrane protein
MMQSATWKTETEKRDWASIPLLGDDYAKFLGEEIARVEAILKDIGLAS